MKKSADKRMYWIRNLSRIKQGAPASWIEYELASEARIEGVLNYANSTIFCGPLTLEPNNQRLFKYLLKVKVAHFDQNEKLSNVSRKGYVLREGLLGELVAILSLALETRFFVLSSSWGELNTSGLKIRNEYSIVHRPCTMDIDPVIIDSKKRNFYHDVPPILDLVFSIKSGYHNELILAFHHYAKALREIAIDDEMVFIRLVSAIEAVAHRMPVPNNKDIMACRKHSEIIREESLSSEEKKEARKIYDVRYSKCRFISFLSAYSKGFFKGGKWKAPHTRILKDDLDNVAATIYNARSAYLHNGIPMYLSTRLRGEYRWHTDPSSGMILGSRRFVKSEKLPYPYFFHRLVRHCLHNYCESLEKNVEETF